MASYPPSRQASRAHPIHGILSAFPLAFFTGALVTDIIYARSTNMQWANFSVWQITFGLCGAVLAAIAGIFDALAHRGARRNAPREAGLAGWHNLLTIFMFAFALINAFIHSRDAYTSVVPTGLILSIVTTILAFLSSWLGFLLLGRREIR